MRERGFSLLEVVAATGLLTVGALAAAQLTVMTTEATRSARVQSITVPAAISRLEWLRSLEWAALATSPPDALDTAAAGFADYLDARGTVVATGTTAPATAVFVRRWAVDLPADGATDLRVLRVVVRTIADDAPGDVRHARGETHLTTLRVRTVQ